MKSICECKITNFFDNYLSFNDFPILESMLGDFINLIKESNILVLKCYKDLFYEKYYKNNKGFFFMISVICVQLICTIIFLNRDLFRIKKYIYNLSNNFIVYINKKKNSISFFPSIKNNNKDSKRDNNSEKKLIPLNDNEFSQTKKGNEIIINNYHKNSSLNNISLDKSKNKIINILNNKDNNYQNTNSITKSNKKEYLNNQKFLTTINNIKQEENNFKEYLTTPLDDLDFDEAIEKDKRKFYEVFIDVVKDKNIIIKTFLISDNIKPRSIKILFLDIIICLYFVINALMYNEEFISELYNSNEIKNFNYFLNNSLNRFYQYQLLVLL